MRAIVTCIIICCITLPLKAQWSLTGNSGTNASTNFIGTTDNVAFKIRTKNLVRLTVSSGGKVGIGITTPVFKLDVKGGSINTDSLYRIGGNAVLRTKLENTLIGISCGDSITTANGNTAVGSYSLNSNISGGNNTAVGGAALRYNKGSQNVAVGYLSLLSNTSGVNNTACGTNTMISNTIGYANTALGHQSLINNTEGYSNTGSGVFSAFSNTTGNSNVAIGANALYANQAESDLVAVGASALYNNTGAGNVAVGANAMFGNTTGTNSVAVGFQSMYSNSNGWLNTAVGYKALYSNTTGQGNTALGNRTLLNNQGNAYYNTAVGMDALISNVSGHGNTALGAVADVSDPALNYATAVGSGSIVGCSFCMVLGISDTKVGIGVNSPGSKLSISNDNSELTGTVISDVFKTNAGNLGGATGSMLKLGNFGFKTTNNSSLGIRAYRFTNTSVDWTTAAILVSYDVDNTFNAGNSTNYLAFSGTGNIGIGTPYPGYLLDVNGLAAKPGGGSWTSSSDVRLKQNVRQYMDGLESVLKIKPVTYHYNEKSGYDAKPEYVGVLAQELKEVAPYMVSTFKNKDNEEYYGVNNSAMTYMLINAVKELNAKVEQLESKLSQCCSNDDRNNSVEGNHHAVIEKPLLEQNHPNPFSTQTVIRFYIPSSSSSAQLVISDASGKQLKSFELKQSGYGEIIIEGNELTAGSYLCSLIIDGIKTETKKMELIK